MDGLFNFAMVTSPNEAGVVVIGGEYTKSYKKRLRNGKERNYERTTFSTAIFELDGKTMKWIRLDQNLKLGRRNHFAIQIPSNLNIELHETNVDIGEKLRILADEYFLGIDGNKPVSAEPGFPHVMNCWHFIVEKLNISVSEDGATLICGKLGTRATFNITNHRFWSTWSNLSIF